MKDETIDCYNCLHRFPLPGDAHSGCKNRHATVQGSQHGIKNGWFGWPFNFDPIWLVSCDGFTAKNIVEG